MPPAAAEFGMLEWKAMYLCCEERATISMSMAEPWVSCRAVRARWRRSGLRKRRLAWRRWSDLPCSA
eukprot:2298398-Pyramimonas_sp.AAC.1